MKSTEMIRPSWLWIAGPTGQSLGLTQCWVLSLWWSPAGTKSPGKPGGRGTGWDDASPVVPLAACPRGPSLTREVTRGLGLESQDVERKYWSAFEPCGLSVRFGSPWVSDPTVGQD